MKPYYPTELDLAYCAGIIDGEGTIGVYKTTSVKRANGEPGFQYFTRLSVGMRDPRVPMYLKNMLGGRVNSCVDGKAMTYRWCANGVAGTLEALMPFLRCKQEEARIAIDFQRFRECANNVRRTKLRRDSNEREYTVSEHDNFQVFIDKLKQQKRSNIQYISEDS